ncbi:hypothetical protein ABN584_01280 [Gloeocapsa sp. BRSZ]
MTPSLSLAPRYRLDDESPWLLGIDPARHYWITVNGDGETSAIAIPGLIVSSLSEFKQTIRQFRALQPQQQMQITRTASSFTIHCISSNCYAVEVDGEAISVWHLFDQESLESLLMTAHPDWQCAERDVDLGRQMLMRSLAQSLVA